MIRTPKSLITPERRAAALQAAATLHSGQWGVEWDGTDEDFIDEMRDRVFKTADLFIDYIHGLSK